MDQKKYRSLWRDYVLAQSAGYFALSFLFIKSYKISEEKGLDVGSWLFGGFSIPSLVPVLVGCLCFVISISLGISLLIYRWRKSQIFESWVKFWGLVFSSAMFMSLIGAWIEGVGSLTEFSRTVFQFFLYGGLAWILILTFLGYRSNWGLFVGNKERILEILPTFTPLPPPTVHTFIAQPGHPC